MIIPLVQLGDLIRIEKGKQASQVLERPTASTRRYLQIDDLRPDAKHKFVAPFACPVASKSDVIIAWDGANAGTVSCNLDGYIGSTLAILRPSTQQLFAPYLSRFLEGKFDYLQENSTGATVPHISRDVLENLEVPLPNLNEQQRIAGLLEQADRLRRTRRYALELSDSFLPAAFLEFFGDPVRNTMNWECAVLEEVCADESGIKAGPFGSSLKKEFYSKSGIRIYGQEQVIGGDFRIGDYYISKEMFFDFAAYEVLPGDLLISLVGSFGKVIVVPKDIERGIINPRLLKITPKPERIKAVFIAKLIEHPLVQRELLRMSHGGTMGILNASLLRLLRVIVPPLPLQEQFAALVAQHEHLRAIQREAVHQAEHLFQTLLHSAFKVATAKTNVIPFPVKIPNISATDLHAGILARAYQHHAQDDRYLVSFGHVKAEKIAHLIEAHLGIDLEREPIKDAAGPNDYPHLMKVESRARKANWFDVRKKTGGEAYEFTKKHGFDALLLKTRNALGERAAEVDALINLLLPLNRRQAEIVATLYAAWNNLLLLRRSPNDEDVVCEARENWNDSKLKIERDKFFRGLQWMREQGLVPAGRGRPVEAKTARATTSKRKLVASVARKTRGKRT